MIKKVLNMFKIGNMLDMPIPVNIQGMGYRQYCRKFINYVGYDNLYYYRDSGENMILGIIKINI